ncbi:hypothetical protein DFH11DRAFT_1850949 [Phellopilus nigrolimitatus]|nr:hypothetical protein DFH11DRAFT_1850949 [Phellopilus nigrolimitatus]
MSFSGTPLGQDRRLDHQTFLKGPSLTYESKSIPPRRVPSINQSIPLSYAYGAPTLGTRSPNTSPSNSPSSRRAQPNRLHGIEDDDDERLSRYAQLKQRNETLASRPGSSLGPGVIINPPQPTAASLKDTSVNIASAFTQAASTYNMPSTAPNSWNGNRAIPRSTSVEYEQQTQNVTHRRLAVPPRRVGGSKPSSKVGSTTRGSDVDNEHSGETIGLNGRAKSPFDTLTDLTQRAVSSATFLMRQRSQEPEEVRPPSRQATDATFVPQNNSGSYDYADEEEEYLETQKTSKKNSSATHKRGRMSTDNKAYRPSTSDLENESDEEFDEDDDGKKGRRRKKKKDIGGGPLTSLPVTQYDKRKKRRGRAGKPGEDISVSDEQEQERSSEQRSRRSVTPLERQPPVSRGSAPPPNRGSVPPESRSLGSFGPTDESVDIEQGLDSIPEVDELNIQPEMSRYRASAKHGTRPRSRSRSRVRSSRPFSIGASLGSLVNMFYRIGHSVIANIFRLISFVTFFFGRVLRIILEIFIFQPLLLIRRGRAFSHLGKYVVVGLGLYIAYHTLKGQNLVSLVPRTRTRIPYSAPEMPPENVEELTSRLLKLENMLAGLQADTLSEHSRLDNDLRRAHEVATRVGQLESRIDKEVGRAQKLEEDARTSTFKGLESLQREIRVLHTRQSEQASQVEGPSTDEEARAKLRALEDRLGSVEGGVKEAIELGQSVAKAGSVGAGAASSIHWWNKVGTGSGSSLTIKTSDGQDVTSLIGALVENALAYRTADGIARVDFALNSGGGSVIPSLTSPTLEIRPAYFFGLVSGTSILARSPVTALHHELALGYCWPFPGTSGHLGVKLAAPVRITDFTIDHVPRAVSLDMRPAPRHMEVWGFVEGDDNLEKLREYRERKDAERQQAREKGHPVPDEEPAYPSLLPKNWTYVRIATFMYDVNAPNNIQTFPVSEEVKSLGIDFGLVVLFINSNWGYEDFTCLYRFRVHGERASRASRA